MFTWRPTTSLGAPAEEVLRVLVEEGERPVARPAQDGAVHVLHELAIALLGLRSLLLGARHGGHVAEVDGEPSVRERVGLAVIDAAPGQASHLELDADPLAHRPLQGGGCPFEGAGGSELQEAPAEELVGQLTHQLRGGLVREREAPVLVDGDEALQAAEDVLEELLPDADGVDELRALELLPPAPSCAGRLVGHGGLLALQGRPRILVRDPRLPGRVPVRACLRCDGLLPSL